MMRWLVLMVVTFALALIVGQFIQLDSGYVLLQWHSYTLESNVWVFIALAVVLMLAMYMLLRLVLLMLGSDWRFNDWRQRRRGYRARQMTTRGLLNMAHGQWRRAERQLSVAADDSDTPMINYLAAARAAYEQNKPEATDEWLKAASQSTKGSELAVGLTQVQLLHNRGQLEQALAVLLKLKTKHPRHAQVLKLLAKTYQELEDWGALKSLIQPIRKFTKIPAEQVAELELKVNLQLLERAVKGHASQEQRVAALKKAFHELPREARRQAVVVNHYIELLVEEDDEGLAETELRGALKSVWHDDLVHWLGRLQGKDGARQLLFAEQQLQERPNDAQLLLALGRLAWRQRDLDKAKSYLEMGLQIKGLPELHSVMGRVLLDDGDNVRACEHFQLALGV